MEPTDPSAAPDPAVPQADARPRVEIHLTREGLIETRLHHPKLIAETIGDHVMACFYKCFMGVERILALEHLIYLNHRSRQERDMGDPLTVDDAAYERNTRVLLFVMAGNMYELGDALQQLCSARVIERLRDRSVWEPLNALRGRWNKNDYAALIRNEIGYHLGNIDPYIAGIRADGAPTTVVWHTLGSPYRAAGGFMEPWNALFRGLGLRDEEMGPFIKKLQESHSSLPDQMMALFTELLASNDIPVKHTRA